VHDVRTAPPRAPQATHHARHGELRNAHPHHRATSEPAQASAHTAPAHSALPHHQATTETCHFSGHERARAYSKNRSCQVSPPRDAARVTWTGSCAKLCSAPTRALAKSEARDPSSDADAHSRMSTRSPSLLGARTSHEGSLGLDLRVPRSRRCWRGCHWTGWVRCWIVLRRREPTSSCGRLR